ncbi:ABC transporter ATP-binding protein, partial [Kingella kingae]
MRYPFSTGLFNMLNIQSLYFSYDDRIVLHDINVQLDEGSITGLIGPNGAGKSTLMRCMAGLEVPSDGEVFLNGKPILDDPRTSFAQLGYLPDFFGLPPDLSVIQCLTYAAKSRGLPDNKLAQTIGETVELLGLQDKLYHKIGALSRGQKQRVGIGQVLSLIHI